MNPRRKPRRRLSKQAYNSQFLIDECARTLCFMIFVFTLGWMVYHARPFGEAREKHSKDFQLAIDLREVLPPFGNHPVREVFWVSGKPIFPMRETLQKKKFAAYAFEVTSEGYDGRMNFLVGVDLKGQVTGITVTRHSEPSGFGDLFLRQKRFFKSLEGKSLKTLVVSQKEEAVHAVTTASVTSRAAVEAARAGSNFFMRNRKQFLREVER